jgi:hypothetical protein
LIIKTLKGRSFGGLLDYLFDPQDKSPPQEIEARGSPENQRISEEIPSPDRNRRETDMAGPSKENPPNDSTEGKQRGDQNESGKTEHEQRGELLITNVAGRSKEELREHFETLAALRPDVEVNVLHGILSMPEEDVLSPATKVRIVLRFVELKGLNRTMFAAIEHNEHKHTEIHVISSTIDFKGRLPSDSFDYDKGEAIARQLEKEFDLKPNRSSRDTMQRAPTQGEWKQHGRTGKLSRPLRLQALVNSALDREVTFTEFHHRLERRGVTLSLLVNDKGKVTGSVYEFEEKHIRGRRLGRGFTWAGLQQDWPDQQERKGRMTYEPERDNEAISRARSSAMGRGRGAGELGERERPVRSISGDESANKRVGREAGSNRKPSHQIPAVGEEGRGAVRNNRPRGKGTARRDGGAPQEHRNNTHTIQRASDDNGGGDQGRVSASAPNSSGVLRRDLEDKRQKRADGWAMPGHGGDEQRGISQGERGSIGNLGENAGASQVRSRSASQRDRGTGAALQDDLQAAGQVGHHRNSSNSPERSHRGDNGWPNDSKVQTTSREGGHEQPNSIKVVEPVQERKAQLKKGDNAQPSNKSNHSHQSSAVDVVLQKLLGSSSREDSTHQFTKGHRELPASKRSLLMIDKDRDEPLLPQNITQEKQKQIEPKEPGRPSSNNRGR